MGDAAITKATTELTLEELAHNMQFDGFISRAANGEMVRRQTKIQMEAAAAQIKAASAQEAAASAAIKAAEAEARAADAAMESAFHARRNAKYMLWSVIFAAASAFISLATTLYTNWPRHTVDRPNLSDAIKSAPASSVPQVPASPGG